MNGADDHMVVVPRRTYYNPKLDPDHERTYAAGGPLLDPDEEHPFNLVSSLCADGLHRPALDLDEPDHEQLRWLCDRYGTLVVVSSSTSGHLHAYVPGVAFTWEQYQSELGVLVEHGVIEDAYRLASIGRQQTLLRPPHVSKFAQADTFTDDEREWIILPSVIRFEDLHDDEDPDYDDGDDEMQRSKPLARVGARAKRERPEWEACKAVVLDRSHGFCEAWKAIAEAGQLAEDLDAYHAAVASFPRECSARLHEGTDPHHMWPEDRDRGVHDPARVLQLCRRAHDWAHANPAHAKALGLLRPETD